MLDRTLADVLAGIVINDYVEGSGWVDAGIEAIILTLTDIVGTAGDVNKDFGAELFREVAMSIMGKGNLPDMNAAAEKNLLYVAKDAAELYKELDEFIFFNDVHLSGWDVYFNEFAETLGYVDVDVFGKVTVLNQRSYDELRNIFKMRKQSDLESLNDHINGMLERWAKDGQCIVEEGFEPRFAYDVKGNICPEGETYAAITKMRNTAESVQKNVKRIGKIADVIGNIADAVSIVSSVSQKVNQLEKIRESYTRNRQFLWAVIQHSKGDSEAVAIQLLSDLQGDFAAEKNNAVFEVLADYGTEKIVEKVIETIDDFAGTSIIGGILAGGQIAGMVPLVQDAKELIDCKQLLIGWAAVKEELDGALERAMKSSSPYTVYLAELYIEWNMKGLEIAEKYFDILRSHRFIVGTSNAQQADEMINRIKEEMLTFRTSYSVPLWNKHF